MQIFDTHTHVFPDKVAEKAVSHLREMSGFIPAYTNGTYSDHAEKSLEAGYTAWMNCPVVTRPGQAISINQWASQHNCWPSLSLGAVHPDDDDVIGILSSIIDLNLPGVKFHPEYQNFDPLEARLSRIWDFCQEHKLPVLFHAGQDIGFKPPYHTTPSTFAELSRRYPEMKLVAAHAGGWKDWDEVEEVLPGTNVFIDTSFSMPFMQDNGQMARLIKRIGVKHVMFGTDSPWQELKEAAAEIANCGLSREELQDVFWNNAFSFWGLDRYRK